MTTEYLNLGITPIFRLYPEKDHDEIALAGLSQSSGSGNINYGVMMSYFMKEVAGGIDKVGQLTKSFVSWVIDLITDIDGIDDDWLEDLGRQEKPLWGDDSWHPAIAPKGYVDRFETATEFMILTAGLVIVRLVIGRIGVGGVAAFVGGKYAANKTRQWREDMMEAFADIDADLEEDLMSDRRIRRGQMWSNDLIVGVAQSLANNNHHPIRHVLNELNQYEQSTEIIGRD